jgi:hypothetical protein
VEQEADALGRLKLDLKFGKFDFCARIKFIFLFF